ncbi:hypothetical protein J7J81_02235 [bacterium]|nr:hypothetical protein [bacterium]
MVEISYKKVYQDISKNLSQRQKEVLERRFGLEDFSRKETLQSIGRDFGVSRERVRQIEQNAFKHLPDKKRSPELKNLFGYFKKYFSRQGGFKRESIVLRDLGGKDFQNYVYLFLNLGGFYRFSETNNYYSFWSVDKKFLEIVRTLLSLLQNKFEKEQRTLPEEELLRVFSPKFSRLQIIRSLEVSKKIEKGIDGLYGLVDWPIILPKRTRDKVYLALKKANKPLHFTKIAEIGNRLTNELETLRTQPSKRILPQTVHNELIRDDRFVLVGRGIYALKEWGYLPGTVYDILVRVLKEHEEGMPLEELLQSVKKQRIVKDNTILLALSNRNHFLRDKEGRYKIREI